MPPARFVQGAVPLQQLDHKHGQRGHLPLRDNPHGPDGGPTLVASCSKKEGIGPDCQDRDRRACAGVDSVCD